MTALRIALIEFESDALRPCMQLLHEVFPSAVLLQLGASRFFNPTKETQTAPDIFITHNCGLTNRNRDLIAKVHQQWRDLPCLLLTAKASSPTLQEACEWGAWDLLSFESLNGELVERAVHNLLMAHRQRKELVRHQSQLERIMRGTRCCLWRMKLEDGALIELSGPAAELLGFEGPDCIGIPFSQIPGFSNASSQLDAMVRELNAGQQVDIDIEYSHPAGHLVWFQFRTTRETDLYAQGMLLDVSSLRDARYTRDILLEAINQAGEAIMITDAEINHPGPRVEFMNAAAERLSGYKIADMRDERLRILHGADSDWRALRELRTCLEAGESFTGELVNYHSTGRPYLCQTAIHPIRAADGSIRHYLSVQRDITMERRVQRALSDSEQRLRQVVDRAPFPVMVLAEDGVIVQISQSWADMSGYRLEDFKTVDDWLALACPGREAKVRKGILSCFSSTDKVIREQGMVMHADGSERIWLFYSAPIRPLSDGRGLLVTMASDVTELQQALSAAEKANMAKDEFLAVMSHELRTPLNPVVGLTDLLLHAEEDPDKLEMLEMVRKSAQGLLRLIENILDYTHIDLSRFKQNREEETVREIIYEVVDEYSEAFENKQLELEIDPSACGRYWDQSLVVDAARSRQLLGHLLNNALKFTSRGKVTIWAAVDKQRSRLELAVTDTGIGIDAEDIDKITAPFYQVDSSTTRKFGGAGLGLAICCRTLEGLGGSLLIDSKPGKGSTFTLQIPVEFPQL